MVGILWTILAIVLVVWLIGLVADVVGNLIHVLLLVALAILVYNLITGRRSVEID
jgi:predicted membrane metal-binding protein